MLQSDAGLALSFFQFWLFPARLSMVVKRINMKGNITALILLAVLVAPVAAASSKVSFPGLPEAPDPTGRYAVVWSDAEPHALLFKDIRKGKLSDLLTFDRHVDVFWSPDGNAFAITDWGGSNYSEAFIYFPTELKAAIDLQDVIKNTFGIVPEIAQNDHVYFEVLGWITPDKLKFKVHGYGDFNRHGFTKRYEYNLKNRKLQQAK